MKVALAQINSTIADFAGNTERILNLIANARSAGAALVVFPELTIFGYPPKDLVLRRELIERNVAALSAIAERCHGIDAVVGYVRPEASNRGKGIQNAAAVCRDGKVIATYAKALLPTYDVFDESRYFDDGRQVLIVTPANGAMKYGVTICEDLWNDHQFNGRQVYEYDPIEATVSAGAKILINLSASPYQAGKQQTRESLFGEQIREAKVPLLYVNQVGGNDDLVFDGGTLAMDATGAVIARARAFVEELLIVDLSEPRANRLEPYPERIESIRQALALGLRDYVHKCGFEGVVLGLSGGIDSALTAALAVEALGPGHVHGVALPSRFSSDHSLADAEELARNLGIDYRVIPIESPHRAMEEVLQPHFRGLPRDVTEENVQARIRGNLLMALSNKFGWLLLTTGNKSELAVGYCTLYGDMCGGLAVLSDVPKTTVYELSRHINRAVGKVWIPQRSIDKPPSAELRENQTDQDTLPPYDVLDAILEQYVEQDKSAAEIAAVGFDRALVDRVVRLVDRSEYKRKQAAVGIKVTSRAFGTGRRIPIAMKSAT